MAQLPPGVDLSHIPFLPPPEGKTSNFIDPPSLAGVLEGVGGLLIAIETILLFLRTVSNVKAFGRIRFEDCWVMFATILTYGNFALLMLYRPVARHSWDIPLTAATKSLFKIVIAQKVLLSSTLFFSKTSLLLLFYRIFSPDKFFRYKLYGAFAFIAATTLTGIPMYLALCIPTQLSSWAEVQIKCSKTLMYGYIQGPTAVIFDLFLIYLPASVIVHLHMPRRRKIGVLAVFATGSLAVIASVIGMAYRIKTVHDPDKTWSIAVVGLCILIESCVSIICSCMPVIPAISNMIVSNIYFITLRSWLLSRYSSPNQSKSSHASSERRNFPGTKAPNEYEPYIELVDSGTAHLSTAPTTQTQIQHVTQPNSPSHTDINKSVELEIKSSENTRPPKQRVEHQML